MPASCLIGKVHHEQKTIKQRRQAMGKDSTTKFIGLDVHSKTISVAIADEGREEEVRYYGTIENMAEAIDKAIKSLATTGVEFRFIYEADPCDISWKAQLRLCARYRKMVAR